MGGADPLDIAARIADGMAVDWPAAESRAENNADRDVLEQLKAISAIVTLRRASGATDADAYPSGHRWGNLVIVRQLSAGSSSRVYLAWDERLERHVALKLLNVVSSPGSDAASSAIQEARLLARVRHPNVLTIHGAERINGEVGIWTEFIEGRTLEAVLRDGGPLPAEDVRDIGLRLCSALEAVHAAGLLHRDVKAQNVMRDTDGRIVLLDFGTGLERQSRGPADVAGTPLYLAPELFGRMQVDARADVYSLGVLLFHLLTGLYPVVGDTVGELRAAHERGERCRLSAIAPPFSRQLASAIDTALAHRPEDRYASVAAFASALTRVATGGRARWSHRAALGALVAILAIAAALVHQRGPYAAVSGVYTERAPARRMNAAAAAPPRVTSPLPSTAPAIQGPAAASALAFEARDWVLIAAFENRTADPALDGTLEYALERELSNSSFVNVVPRERIDDVLELMRKPMDSRIDETLGREICLRDGGIRALIAGRVEKIGASYVITTELVDPRTGTVEKSISETATAPAGLLSAVRRESFRVRETLGEMLSTIRDSEAALEKVTTPSLHALQLYSQASTFMRGETWNNPAAEQLLRQAVAEDANFASAHILLAWAIHNQGRPADEFLPFASRASELAARTSDVERYFILGSYESLLAEIPQRVEESNAHRRKAAALYEALLRIKPDHYWGVFNLANEYTDLQEEPQATDALLHAAEVRSGSLDLRFQAVSRLLARGDVDRARTYVREIRTLLSHDRARQAPHDAMMARLAEASVAWASYDVTRVRRIADALAPAAVVPDVGAPAVVTLSNVYFGLGRVGDRNAISERLSPEARDAQAAIVLIHLVDLGKPGALESLRGFMAEHYPDLRGLPFNPYVAMPLIKLGRLDEARRYIAPFTTTPWGAHVQAFLEIGAGNVQEGIRWFGLSGLSGVSAELRTAGAVADGWHRQGQREKAISILEGALKNRWPAVLTEIQGVAYYVRDLDLLSRLYREVGRQQDANEVDKQLWKLVREADPDYPVLARLRAQPRALARAGVVTDPH